VPETAPRPSSAFTPSQPLADLLRSYFRIDDRNDLGTARAKVTGTLLNEPTAQANKLSPVCHRDKLSLPRPSAAKGVVRGSLEARLNEAGLNQ